MEIVLLLFGFVIGLVVAWFFLGASHTQQLASQEAELRLEMSQANEDLAHERAAHEKTKQRLSETQAKEASAIKRAENLETDLGAKGAELERVRDSEEK